MTQEETQYTVCIDVWEEGEWYELYRSQKNESKAATELSVINKQFAEFADAVSMEERALFFGSLGQIFQVYRSKTPGEADCEADCGGGTGDIAVTEIAADVATETRIPPCPWHICTLVAKRFQDHRGEARR